MLSNRATEKRTRCHLPVALAGAGFFSVAALLATCCLITPPRAKQSNLQISFAGLCGKPDFGTVAFHLSAPVSCAIFFDRAEVEVPSFTAWRTATTYPRSEIVRLQPNIPHEFCVDPPGSGDWRVSIHYGTEMSGLPLLRAQLREAWILRSFSSWTGKTWGGGRFGGAFTLEGPEIQAAR